MGKTLLVTIFLSAILSAGMAQTPGIKWSKYVGTQNAQEVLYDGQRTADKGYILVGLDTGYNFSYSNVFQKLNNGGNWMVKVDSIGSLVWKKRIAFGPYSPYNSALESICRTTDGNYLVAGYVWAYPDTANYHIAKINDLGNVIWDTAFGGSGDDRAFNVKQTADGGYIVAGYSTSVNNGDVVQAHSGGSEAWLIKVAAAGNKQWTYTYGGNSSDTAYAVLQTPDGGYLVCGASKSSNGDLPGNKGQTDGWVFKINSSGTVVWTKNFGGSGRDVLNNIVQNSDNTYTLSGFTFSNDGDVSGSHGQSDMWVIKVDDTGNLIWSKTYGGSADDASFGLYTGYSGGWFVTGFTKSDDGQVTGHAGGADCWTIRLDATGNLLWQKCSGTVNDEYAMAILPATDADFTIVGYGKPLTQPSWGGVDASDGLVIKYSNANSIRGTVFFDANSNGIKDAGEINYDNATIKTQKSGFTASAISNDGYFNIDVDTGSYLSSVQLPSAYFAAVPASKTSVFSGYYNVDSFGIAIQPVAGKKDLFISLNPIVPARPGFDVSYQIIYKNLGTVNIPSGTVTLNIDPKLSYVSASTPPSAIGTNTLSWNYTNLNALDTATILLTLNLATPPTTHLGDTLHLQAVIDPVTGDETPRDDTANLKQRVVGSYDPNDKTEANAGIITPAQVSNGEYLNYTIRFQNTGTDTAFNVIVRDTLESRLDWSSLQMVSASHPYQLTIADGNKLTWQFNGIKLLDSSTDEPHSHGYIAYRIKPLSTVHAGDTIKNTAGIYFDFNLPVATNTNKTVVFLISSSLPVTLISFQAAQAGSIVNVSWKTSEELNAKYFEVQRSSNGIDFITIGTVPAGNTTYLFKDNSPLTGYNYYRLRPVDIDGRSTYSTIVMVNMKVGAEVISSLYPNPGNGNVTLKLQGTVQGNVMVQVLDQQGREVTTKQFGVQHTGEFKTPLDLGRLSKGSYILRIVVDDKVYLQKLLIE